MSNFLHMLRTSTCGDTQLCHDLVLYIMPSELIMPSINAVTQPSTCMSIEFTHTHVSLITVAFILSYCPLHKA